MPIISPKQIQLSETTWDWKPKWRAFYCIKICSSMTFVDRITGSILKPYKIRNRQYYTLKLIPLPVANRDTIQVRSFMKNLLGKDIMEKVSVNLRQRHIMMTLWFVSGRVVHGASGGTNFRIYVAIPICFHKKKLLVNC